MLQRNRYLVPNAALVLCYANGWRLLSLCSLKPS